MKGAVFQNLVLTTQFKQFLLESLQGEFMLPFSWCNILSLLFPLHILDSAQSSQRVVK